MKYAAIDIGSNAVRLLITQTHTHNGETRYKKVALVRVPLRLGHDAFTSGKISTTKIKTLTQTMQAFAHLIAVHEVKHTMACATSALREASNGPALVQQLRRKTGLKIHIITGRREAEILYGTHIAEQLDKRRSYLYIDIGGGSTELTLFSKNKIVASNSFNLGTIRILEDREPSETWTEIKLWLTRVAGQAKGTLIGIGTGGNVNKIYRLSKTKKNNLLTYAKIRDLSEELETYSFEERMAHFNLNPDRADVIVPAAKILLWAMKWSKIRRLHVPAVGLVDGMVGLMGERFSR